jgi:hypothetical protein
MSTELRIEYDEQGIGYLPLPEGIAETFSVTEVQPRPRNHGVWDRITFHPNLTVRQLRDIAAVYGVHIRPKASRDEVALIMRRHGIADEAAGGTS